MAAVWSSGGGGEIIKDARNPWFLQNTPAVNVCLIHDRDHFDAGARDIDDLRSMVQSAVDYWRYEFAQAFRPWRRVAVATQIFNFVDTVVVDRDHPARECGSDPDLTIQLGYLNPVQRRFLAERDQNPKDFISFAIRTDYDPVQLKGKGFVYIAADSGDLKFEGPNLVSKPWSMGDGGLLHAALKHELGHVFGLPHIGSSLMNAGYLEAALKTEIAPAAAKETHEKDFFSITRPGTLRAYCQQAFMPGWRRFMGLAADQRCYEYRLNGNRVELRFGANASDLRYWGSINLDPMGREFFSWVEAVRIYLPAEQRVFDDCPASACERPWLLGPMLKIVERSGEFVDRQGVRRPMTVTFSPLSVGDTYVKFGGMLDGKLVPNLEQSN